MHLSAHHGRADRLEIIKGQGITFRRRQQPRVEVDIEGVVEDMVRVTGEMIGAVVGSVDLYVEGLRDDADRRRRRRGRDGSRLHSPRVWIVPGEAIDVLGLVTPRVRYRVEYHEIAGVEDHRPPRPRSRCPPADSGS